MKTYGRSCLARKGWMVSDEHVYIDDAVNDASQIFEMSG